MYLNKNFEYIMKKQSTMKEKSAEEIRLDQQLRIELKKRKIEKNLHEKKSKKETNKVNKIEKNAQELTETFKNEHNNIEEFENERNQLKENSQNTFNQDVKKLDDIIKDMDELKNAFNINENEDNLKKFEKSSNMQFIEKPYEEIIVKNSKEYQEASKEEELLIRNENKIVTKLESKHQSNNNRIVDNYIGEREEINEPNEIKNENSRQQEEKVNLKETNNKSKIQIKPKTMNENEIISGFSTFLDESKEKMKSSTKEIKEESLKKKQIKEEDNLSSINPIKESNTENLDYPQISLSNNNDKSKISEKLEETPQLSKIKYDHSIKDPFGEGNSQDSLRKTHQVFSSYNKDEYLKINPNIQEISSEEELKNLDNNDYEGKEEDDKFAEINSSNKQKINNINEKKKEKMNPIASNKLSQIQKNEESVLIKKETNKNNDDLLENKNIQIKSKTMRLDTNSINENSNIHEPLNKDKDNLILQMQLRENMMKIKMKKKKDKQEKNKILDEKRNKMISMLKSPTEHHLKQEDKILNEEEEKRIQAPPKTRQESRYLKNENLLNTKEPKEKKPFKPSIKLLEDETAAEQDNPFEEIKGQKIIEYVSDLPPQCYESDSSENENKSTGKFPQLIEQNDDEKKFENSTSEDFINDFLPKEKKEQRENPDDYNEDFKSKVNENPKQSQLKKNPENLLKNFAKDRKVQLIEENHFNEIEETNKEIKSEFIETFNKPSEEQKNDNKSRKKAELIIVNFDNKRRSSERDKAFNDFKSKREKEYERIKEKYVMKPNKRSSNSMNPAERNETEDLSNQIRDTIEKISEEKIINQIQSKKKPKRDLSNDNISAISSKQSVISKVSKISKMPKPPTAKEPSSKKDKLNFGKIKGKRKNIMNALKEVCLSGEVNKPKLSEMFEKLAGLEEDKSLLILFNDQLGRLDYKGMFVYESNNENWSVIDGKLYFDNLKLEMINKYYKYDSGTKKFTELTNTKSLSSIVDAISIKPEFFKNPNLNL